MPDATKITKNLIYILIRKDLNPDEIEEIKKISASCPIDFEYIYQISLGYGIENLVYSNIKKYLSDIVPSYITSLFEERRKTILKNNVLLYKELLYITRLLKQSNISFALIKGPILSERLYNDIGIRLFADIDILIKEKDGLNIKNILLSYDYKMPANLSSVYGVSFRKSQKHSPLIEFQTEFTKEALSIPNIDYEKDIWGTIQIIKLDNSEFPVLSYENELLYLCLHFLHHFYFYFVFFCRTPLDLKWLCDIHNFIDRYNNQIDWDLFVEKCKKYSLSSMVYYIFFVSKTYLKTPIPTNTYAKLRPCFISSYIIKSLASEPIHSYRNWRRITTYYKAVLLYSALLPVQKLPSMARKRWDEGKYWGHNQKDLKILLIRMLALAINPFRFVVTLNIHYLFRSVVSLAYIITFFRKNAYSN